MKENVILLKKVERLLIISNVNSEIIYRFDGQGYPCWMLPPYVLYRFTTRYDLWHCNSLRGGSILYCEVRIHVEETYTKALQGHGSFQKSKRIVHSAPSDWEFVLEHQSVVPLIYTSRSLELQFVSSIYTMTLRKMDMYYAQTIRIYQNN